MSIKPQYQEWINTTSNWFVNTPNKSSKQITKISIKPQYQKSNQHKLSGYYYFLVLFLLSASLPDVDCTALLAVFSCKALVSLSRRWSGVNPSSFFLPPFVLRTRLCLVCGLIYKEGRWLSERLISKKRRNQRDIDGFGSDERDKEWCG